MDDWIWEIVQDDWSIVKTLLEVYPSSLSLSEFRTSEITIERGFCARLSKPGYLDCTDWIGPFSTWIEAAEALAWQYGEIFEEYRDPWQGELLEAIEQRRNGKNEE